MTTMEDRSEKYHYAILKDGKEEIVYWFKGLKYPYSRGYCHQVYQYLAPVPSYEEWEEKTKSLKVLAEAYCKEKQKNDEIKELLKQSKVYIENFIEGSTIINDHHISYILLQRINEILK